MSGELIFLCGFYFLVGMGVFDGLSKIGMSLYARIVTATIWPYVITSAIIQFTDSRGGDK
jgi:hypothetical protein